MKNWAMRDTNATKKRHWVAVVLISIWTTCNFFSTPSIYIAAIALRDARYSISSLLKAAPDERPEITWLAQPKAIINDARHDDALASSSPSNIID